MNWYNGSIAEAVAASKQKNATFVVYVEGNDENSVKLSGYLNHPSIKEKLERDCFVAVKIEGGSEAYMQFARIYHLVPLPSIFFIGKNGTPLEIATGVIGSLSELERKIENVLTLTGNAASASAAFISGEQKKQEEQTAKSVSFEKESPKKVPSQPPSQPAPQPPSQPAPQPPSQPAPQPPSPSVSPAVVDDSQEAVKSVKEEQPASTSKPEPTVSTKQESKPGPAAGNDIICTDAVCFRKPRNDLSNTVDSTSSAAPAEENANAETTPVTVPTTSRAEKEVPTTSTSRAETEDAATIAAGLEQAQKLIEERRKLKQAEEDRKEREREINRRKDGKSTQNFQQWQKEQDFKDLKESIRRGRMEDQAARQRILEQIASDRAERANKFAPPVVAPTTPPPQPSAPVAANVSDMSRIQFRIPNGETSTQTFESADTFGTVRAYVKGEVIKGTGIRDFTLATTFPKHEFVTEDDTKTLQSLGLCPNAVILVIAKASSGPSAVVARTGGIVNIFNTLFWTLLTPIIAVFGYVRNFIIGGNGGDANARPANTGAQKRASEEQSDANDVAKKRNLDRFRLNKDEPSTSKDSATAGNSTGVRRRVGGSNIHRLSDQRKDSDDENNTWNGNSTQQQ